MEGCLSRAAAHVPASWSGVQLVDVHQGALADHAYDRHVFHQHLQEIVACHAASVGPFFLVRLGLDSCPVKRCLSCD